MLNAVICNFSHQIATNMACKCLAAGKQLAMPRQRLVECVEKCCKLIKIMTGEQFLGKRRPKERNCLSQKSSCKLVGIARMSKANKQKQM